MWWHWGQGAEFAWVERTQPLIIIGSKQLVLLGLFSLSDGERVHFGIRRKGRKDEKGVGRRSQDGHPYFVC